jgi:hypothetical protein
MIPFLVSVCIIVSKSSAHASSQIQGLMQLRANSVFRTTPFDVKIDPLCVKSFIKEAFNRVEPYIIIIVASSF